MIPNRTIQKLSHSCFFLLLILTAGCILTPQRIADSESNTQPFLPPTLAPTSTPTTQPSPTPEKNVSAENCTNVLSFLKDLTIPDGTGVKPGEKLDKQWKVINNGTCNWGEGYTLRLIAGPEMGVKPKQPLFPARVGSQATIQIEFTAPTEPGSYRSAWQAYTPGEEPFGDPVFIEIVVETP